jgi:hypothetical protein
MLYILLGIKPCSLAHVPSRMITTDNIQQEHAVVATRALHGVFFVVKDKKLPLIHSSLTIDTRYCLG